MLMIENSHLYRRVYEHVACVFHPTSFCLPWTFNKSLKIFIHRTERQEREFRLGNHFLLQWDFMTEPPIPWSLGRSHSLRGVFFLLLHCSYVVSCMDYSRMAQKSCLPSSLSACMPVWLPLEMRAVTLLLYLNVSKRIQPYFPYPTTYILNRGNSINGIVSKWK